jgi:hypothetical protein
VSLKHYQGVQRYDLSCNLRRQLIVTAIVARDIWRSRQKKLVTITVKSQSLPQEFGAPTRACRR